MQCFICKKDSVGEVCNSCVRQEQNYYTKDYTYKEGLLVKKTEDFKIAVSNARVNGIAIISTSSSGMNARVDNFNHFIGGVIGMEACTYNGKPAPGVHIKTPAGMERYLILPQFTDESGLKSAIDQGKANQLSAGAAAPAAAPVAAAAAPAGGGGGLTPQQQDRLNKLNLLKQNGILSEAEFQAEKAKLGL